MSEVLDNILEYFLFHLLFFVAFTLQNYFFGVNHVQYSFVILVAFYLKYVNKLFRNLKDARLMRQRGKWLRPRIYLRIVEHLLLSISMVLIAFYIQREDPVMKLPGYVVLAPPLLSAAINLFLVRYIQTPCNATYFLTMKVVLFLRLMIGISVVCKVENYATWDWTTTFWPYWCSFAIQGILVLAAGVIFVNTFVGVLKKENKYQEMLGSLWAFLICAGFAYATLDPIL